MFLVAYLIFINIISFVLFGYDKKLAEKEKYRIPERTLMLFSAAGGAFGSFAGMHIFHHKTRKTKFYIGVPVLMIIWVLLLICAVLW